ncbi:MAG: ribosome maturation factor RimP [Myxococcales bacterium]|nr:ribosome maturation factor RimP [Myxococcales bacterium]
MVSRPSPAHAKRPTHEDSVPAGGDVDGHEAAAKLLEDAVEPVARAMGYEVVLIEWAGGRGGRIVRVYLDHPSGVSLDDCTRMSRIFSNALDAAEADPQTPALAALLAQPYTLEVSSPGLDRPLVKLSHFARCVGGRAVIKTRHAIRGGDPDQRTFHGRIVGTAVDPGHADDDRRGIVNLKALDGDNLYDIALADIRRAHLVYEPSNPVGHKPVGTAADTGTSDLELEADEDGGYADDSDDADEEDVNEAVEDTADDDDLDDDSTGPRG